MGIDVDTIKERELMALLTIRMWVLRERTQMVSKLMTWWWRFHSLREIMQEVNQVQGGETVMNVACGWP